MTTELYQPTGMQTEVTEAQRQAAWMRDRALIEDFFNQPGKYLSAYWQTYKPIVFLLIAFIVALIAVNFVLSMISFVTHLPIIGALLELVGIGYSIWFTQRYLLKAETREELFQQIDQLKQEVAGSSSITVKKSVTISRTPEELYQFWRNFENLPRFMNHLESVRVMDDKRSHWVMKAPLDTTVEWDAEIIDEKENQSIVWKSLEGAEVDSVGSVVFNSANGSGTEVKVTMQYHPPAGEVGAIAAAVLGENPEQQLDEDLQRFKQVMETVAV